MATRIVGRIGNRPLYIVSWRETSVPSRCFPVGSYSNPYQGFESYWPKVALDPASPKGLVEYAHQLNAMRKLVFSKTLSRVEWNNSTLVKEIVPEEITTMKHEPGRDMVIHGSASIVRTLTNLGLIDHYQLLVYPVVLGSGKPLWSDILHQVKLSLVSTKTHPSGVVVLSYQLIKE